MTRQLANRAAISGAGVGSRRPGRRGSRPWIEAVAARRTARDARCCAGVCARHVAGVKRAASKITFPNVWTNACCSHPLHGRVPDEVDREDHGEMPGIKHGARRKLRHELGVAPTQVPHADFRYLKRFRYWAADTVTYGPQAPWGEHEMDYALFVQADVDLTPNADEVDEIRYA